MDSKPKTPAERKRAQRERMRASGVVENAVRLDLTGEELSKLDAVRGDLSRVQWVRELVIEALGGGQSAKD